MAEKTPRFLIKALLPQKAGVEIRTCTCADRASMNDQIAKLFDGVFFGNPPKGSGEFTFCYVFITEINNYDAVEVFGPLTTKALDTKLKSLRNTGYFVISVFYE